MFKSIPFFLAVGVVTTMSACAKPEPDYVVVAPEPISVEPVYTGKYK
ncbi:hypothetical protein [Pseudooceanicola sediminis]|nr:hypothetical protein [Pseudooceanicola sediminis]|tara:strand:+ start:18421 stop:18561 length:141 start_codon:yes stop_codon:yes gene_type:complete